MPLDIFHCEIACRSANDNHEIDPDIHAHHKQHDEHLDGVAYKEHEAMMNPSFILVQIPELELAEPATYKAKEEGKNTPQNKASGGS